MKKAPLYSAPAPRQQRGVVLLIALIMLVAMTLVGVSMLRTIGAGVGIAGNLAFKRSATSAADLGIELARTWLVGNSPVLETDVPANGYYSTWADGFNPQTYNWANSKKLKNADANFIGSGTAKDLSGNEIRYVLHRLCALTGAVSAASNPGQKCANFTDYAGLSSKGGGGYGGASQPLSEQPYYRVTVRVSGPRNTISYVQVVMY